MRNEMIMRRILTVLLTLWATFGSAQSILIQNVNIFDGHSPQLIEGQSVMIQDNLITAIGADLQPTDSTMVLDGSGRTLMPGLIDSHYHFGGYTPFNIQARQNVNEFMVGALSMVRAESMLMRGFTTVRDTGGPSTYLRKLFDPGIAPGPRVYGAEQMITQTGGHGDFRGLTNVNPNLEGGPLHWYERHLAIIADGPAEFTRAAREAFRNGADFFKVFVSGGVSSEFDPIHALQSTREELEAVVKIAEQNQTYVTAHCQTAAGAHHAIDAGIKMLEHVPMIGDTPEDIEDVVKRIAEEGIWIEFNNGAVLGRSPEELEATMSPASFQKALAAIESIDLAVKSFAKYNVPFVLGTDAVAPWGAASLYADIGAWPAEFKTAMKYYDNLSVLKGVTYNGGLVAKMTGPNNPYPLGDIGVIKEGAYADILVVDGNPLEDPMILMDAEKNMAVIMKDGIMYKNTLSE